MSRQYTEEELNNLSPKALSEIILSQQAQLNFQQSQLKALNSNISLLLEQARISNQVSLRPPFRNAGRHRWPTVALQRGRGLQR